ncbi:hypothetical protein GCM10009430_11970 [Aquimarina litoralis]|uniref:DUF4142 domain-containing protein n=1 Tax=Aquimarina litoralis TaxID=584605 RepID=A0ABP3TRH8_9FLAO
MKIIYQLCILVLFSIQVGYGQFIHLHTHINNNDAQTRAKLSRLITILGIRNTTLTAVNSQLSRALVSHQTQLNLQYRRNPLFDKRNEFIASSLGTSLLNLGTSEIANSSLPYMTKEKREYMKEANMDLALLLALQYVSTSKIKSSKRQEIYRLRSKLLREFSKNGRDARQSLFLSAAGISVLNYEEFLELYKYLKLIQITM